MTAADTCVRCGENPSVPGRFGRRCDECLTELFGKSDGHPDDAVVLTLEYPDGRARRYVIDDAGDGTHRFAEFTRTKGGTWRSRATWSARTNAFETTGRTTTN